MHQSVQSAIEVAKQGYKDKAVELLKGVIIANPNDVDAWMVLAAVVDDPQRKRQCLNRVLTIDPNHQLAREELLEMNGVGTVASTAPGEETISNANFHEQAKSPFDVQAKTSDSTNSKGSSKVQTTQTKTFQKNLFIIFALSGFLIFFGFSIFLPAITISVRSIARIGAWFGAASFITGFSLLFQVITVTIDADQLILITLWGKTILSRDDILDIKLHSPGNIRESVNVILNTGRQYRLQGFSDGNKVIFRFLKEWLNGI